MIEPLDLTLTFLEKHPADAARVLESLPPTRTAELLSEVEPRYLGQTLNHMAADYTASCVPLVSTEKKVQLFRLLETQTAVDVFRYLDNKEKYRLLYKLPLSKRLAIQTVNKYNQNSVGAWMSTEYLSVKEDKTVEEVIELIQGSESTQDYVFVVNVRRELVSIVKTSQLLKTSLSAQISAVRDRSVFSLTARTTIQEASSHEAWKFFHTLPVVEHDNRLVGALAYSDMSLALEKAHVEFSARTAGVGDEALSLFWVVFNNFIQLLNDLFSMAARKQ